MVKPWCVTCQDALDHVDMVLKRLANDDNIVQSLILRADSIQLVFLDGAFPLVIMDSWEIPDLHGGFVP